MVSKKVTLVNAQGFHMRPASVFATAMGCIKCGSEIELVCDGPDENEALADAVERIESGLGE